MTRVSQDPLLVRYPSGGTHERALGDLIPHIRETALRTADELEPGCAVKIAGEWYAYEGRDLKGHMVLRSAEDGYRDTFHYGPGDGETFAWFDGIGPAA